MPARISSSVTESIDPPPRRARSSAYGPSAGLPIASDLAIVSGFTGRQMSQPASNACATGEQPSACAPLNVGSVALEQPDLEPLVEAARDLREQRARRDRRHDAVGQLEAELLGDLEGERLRALGVVGPHVHVDERPVALAGELGAEPVHVVVVAAHGHEVRAVDARGEDLLLLEVGRDEHVRLEPGGRGVRGHGVRQVAGRRAGHRPGSRAPAPSPARPTRRGP